MKRYFIGYLNQQWSQFFMILAETWSRATAEFIRQTYNEGYRRAGFPCELMILTDRELPADSRYSTDIIH